MSACASGRRDRGRHAHEHDQDPGPPPTLTNVPFVVVPLTSLIAIVFLALPSSNAYFRK
ncbi:hypothetical protein [Nonomuraea africana]|uniref:Uncharacterized protein n=1 Tax=Nonomuraea africana TaxID=46171 RepID=A0ABR9KRA1_9ACTN|nr:hypothetical protein [Nonomuraea africana]MBE1564554.1 hypothetical protein [Nonomuraea africana]